MPLDPLILPAGSLRQSITILEPTTTTDVSGTATAYSTFLTTRCAIDVLSGTDQWKDGQVTSVEQLVVTMRYVPGVVPSMMVTWNGETFIIRAIENVQKRNRVLKLLCEALNQA